MQTIVHITDLHHSRSGSLRGDVSRAFIENAVIKLSELRKDKSLGIEPILVITGDIVQSGADNPEGSDYECLQTDVLSPIMEAMGIDSSQVVLCPGNHELDRFAVDEDDKVRDYVQSSSDVIKADLQKKLPGFFGFVEKHGYRSVTRDSPRIATFEFGKTNITVLNALAGIYSDGSDLGEAFLTPTEVQAGLNVIPNYSVVCMHHPVEWLNTEIRQAFTSLLGRKRCRLLTGHEHKPSAQFVQEGKNRMVMVRGGAAGETGEISHFSLINLSPDSEAINLRKFCSTLESGGFKGPTVDDSECHPDESRQFFMKTRAFLTTTRIQDIAKRVAGEQGDYLEKLLENVHGHYIEPPLAVYDDNELNSKHCVTSRILEVDGVAVIGGDELSGKTTLTLNSVFNMNMSGDTESILLFLDFRILNTETIEAVAVKKLKAAGCTNDDAKMLMRNKAVKIVIDNFSPAKHRAKVLFRTFKKEYPTTPMILVTAGGGRFNPSNAPSFLPEDTIYFRIKDINRETAIKMAGGMPDTAGLDSLKLAGRVFKSLSLIHI